MWIGNKNQNVKNFINLLIIPKTDIPHAAKKTITIKNNFKTTFYKLYDVSDVMGLET